MRISLWLPIFCVCAWADEAADRTAIIRTLAALNEFPQRAELFTVDADARSDLPQLWKGKRLVYRTRSQTGDTGSPSSPDRPTVTISHEPWGEAIINFPGVGTMSPLEILNPRIESSTIRFITPDVALADGSLADHDSTAQATPLLFVMKREAADWKIAAIRMLAPG